MVEALHELDMLCARVNLLLGVFYPSLVRNFRRLSDECSLGSEGEPGTREKHFVLSKITATSHGY